MLMLSQQFTAFIYLYWFPWHLTHVGPRRGDKRGKGCIRTGDKDRTSSFTRPVLNKLYRLANLISLWIIRLLWRVVILCTIMWHFPSVPWCLSAFHSTSRSQQELTCTTRTADSETSWEFVHDLCDESIMCAKLLAGREPIKAWANQWYYSRTCVWCHQLFTRKSPTGDKLCNFLSFAVIKPPLCFRSTKKFNCVLMVDLMS